jgi:protoheme IX farnesyltransferase
MSLVVFTALVGMLIAPGGLHPFVALVAILSIAIGAGASGALNMWYDSDVDAVMSRTANRPIPAGRMGREEALVFGVVLSVLSVATLGLATNWLAAGLLAFTIFFYAVIYTMWLKRATPQNIVIGGAAGAFPPAIGWAAVTGSVGIEAVAMFLIIFLWTPPHFWALALYKRGDYHAAGIPMLPNVAGDRATQIQIFIYSLVLFAVSLVPVITGFGGAIYGTVAVVSGLAFVVMAWRLLSATKDNLHRAARYLFTYSLSYLFVVFLALFTDRVFIMLGGF